MKIFKIVIIVALLVTISVALVINSSSVSTTYVCKDNSPTREANNVFVTIEKYHPWTNIWSSSSGKLTFDVPLKRSDIYNHLVQKENSLHIYKDNETTIQGTYFETTNNLSLNSVNSSFKGGCQLLNTSCANNLTH